MSAEAGVGRTARRTAYPGTAPILTVSALVFCAAACAAAPVIAPYDPTAFSANLYAGPSAEHWLGTDQLGRDTLSRLLHGGRITLVVTVGATLLAMLLGYLWGSLAAMRGGAVDNLLMRLADIWMAVPQILFALVLVTGFGVSLTSMTVSIGLLLTPVTARVVRSLVLEEMTREYYLSAVSVGATPARIVVGELLPNIAPGLFVQAAINAASALFLEATLSFLGIGVQPPSASWGTLLQEGYAALYQSTWLVVFPGLLIFVVILLLNVLGNQLGTILDPRRRR